MKRANHDVGDAADSVHLSGADLSRIRLSAARDLIAEADPAKLVRVFRAFYAKGFRDGQARPRTVKETV